MRFVDPDGRAPTTDYYGLNGKNVRHVEDGKNDKKLILTDLPFRKDAKEEAITKSISDGKVIDVPSNEVVAKMELAYNNTKKSGKENGFIVGKTGKSSIMVEGSEGSIKKEWKAAQDDITSKGDLKSYDVHTHPIERDQDGKIINVGTPSPSGTDMSNASVNHPDAVLGYIQVIPPAISGQMGGERVPQEIKQIGFYNSNGSLTGPTGIKFDDFKSAVNKINK